MNSDTEKVANFARVHNGLFCGGVCKRRSVVEAAALMFLEVCPVDIQIFILVQLDVVDILSVRRVNKYMLSRLDDKSCPLWKLMCQLRWGPKADPFLPGEWRELFLEKVKLERKFGVSSRGENIRVTHGLSFEEFRRRNIQMWNELHETDLNPLATIKFRVFPARP
jgi:hypothetical protein